MENYIIFGWNSLARYFIKIKFDGILLDLGQYYINLNYIKNYNFKWDANLVTYPSSLIEIFQIRQRFYQFGNGSNKFLYDSDQ